jgi:calcineurin-like phosphoesterase family protein
MENYTTYCWWTGDNELSENRKKSLETMKIAPGGNIVFIDKNNLKDYILTEHPLHEGYQYLSPIQKGDYLKCYFMHHYGGGYSDIKQTSKPWTEYFDRLGKDKNLYAIGYSERAPNHVAYLEDCRLDPQESIKCRTNTLSEDGKSWTSQHLTNNWTKLIGCGLMICRKNTPFTRDWWEALNEKMDGYLEELKKYPAQWPRDSHNHVNPNTGEKSKYPIAWAVLHGHVYHPLTLKYHKNIDQDLTYPVMSNYQ